MTISPDIQPGDDSQRVRTVHPSGASDTQATSAASTGAKILWMILLVIFGIIGVYLMVVLFSMLVGMFSGDTAPQNATPQPGAPASLR